MAISAYSGVYNEYVLTYLVPGGGSTEDEFGNVTEGTGPRTVKAWLETPRAPNVTAQIGADTVQVAYEGALTDPASPPAGFITGTEVTFSMDGRTVKGRVKVFAPDPIAEIEEAEGRRIQITAGG